MYISSLASTRGGIVPAVVEYLAVIIGVFGGSTFACNRKLDIVGTISLGLIAGFGGGIIRDVMLQDEGVYFTEHPILVLTCVVVSGAVFYYFRNTPKQLDSVVFLLNTLAVGLLAATGVHKAYLSGSGVVMSFILGGITSVGGGMLRDVFVGEVPVIFKEGTYYAIAGLAGAAVYDAFLTFGYSGPWAVVVCVAVTTALRYLSVFFNWRTAADPQDLTPYVTKPLRRMGALFHELYLHGTLSSSKRSVSQHDRQEANAAKGNASHSDWSRGSRYDSEGRATVLKAFNHNKRKRAHSVYREKHPSAPNGKHASDERA